jgi:hypothetical protein
LEAKNEVDLPQGIKERSMFEHDFEAHMATHCAPCPTRFHPTVPLSILAAEAMVTRLHGQSRYPIKDCDCIFCSPGDVPDVDYVRGHLEKDGRWIPHRMPLNEATCKITHTKCKPFCCKKAAALAGLVGKEGSMAWLDGCNAADAGMELGVCFMSHT